MATVINSGLAENITITVITWSILVIVIKIPITIIWSIQDILVILVILITLIIMIMRMEKRSPQLVATLMILIPDPGEVERASVY